MTNYTVKLTKDSAEIVGLPDVYLHFAHHDYNTVWNGATQRHEVDHNANAYFGGCGEGRKLPTWQDAIHCSLYDAFQIEDCIKDGDTFSAEYNGQTANFVCEGFHVLPVNKEWQS